MNARGGSVDLHDVQGNIIKGYGRFGFPVARYVMYRIGSQEAGRAFVRGVLPLITTSAPWGEGPTQPLPFATTNIGFTYEGLKQLAVPEASLHSFPEDFSMGMRARTTILGDDGPSEPAHWDPLWTSVDDSQVVHVLVTINARSPEHLDERYRVVTAAMHAANAGVEADAGVVQLVGHRDADRNDAPYQSAAALVDGAGHPGPKEHFGYTDGISDPFFEDSGQAPERVAGGGKRTRNPATDPSGWEALATGEFILGHVDEADEYPAAPIPSGLARNGTFLVYRKLHENVGSFNTFLAEQAAVFGDLELAAAKLAGRWRNGAPLTTFPTRQSADEFGAQLAAAAADRQSSDPAVAAAATETYRRLRLQLTAFDYDDDLVGGRCPVGAHARRSNPRGALEFGKRGAFDRHGALVDRRRIARRGLPYGAVIDPLRNDGDHGIIFMAIGASISRQFEFIQQQWINYGNDFRLANERDPLVGNHPADGGRFIVQSDPTSGRRPIFCAGIPRFVETRGGDYFFVPSLTALSHIERGTIDPT